jgi:CDGSH-type Zn-finger protein
MDEAAGMQVEVTENGPYRVTGKVPLAVQRIVPNEHGESWEWAEGQKFEVAEEYFLCRCGHSKSKPFCDGSHERVGFNGTESASRRPIERESKHFDGPTDVLSDDDQLCAFARFCDPGGQIWNLMARTGDPRFHQVVVHEGEHCPSGRLVLKDKSTGEVHEPKLPPSIGVIEDTTLKCSGPLWVRGGIRVQSANGKPYEIRNRITLCRCGVSTNKPFCNGSHASIKFQDGLR